MGRIYFRTTAYNAEKTVARCIESVLNQTKYGDDIIFYICDNGSADKTGEIMRKYASEDSRIKLFSNKANRVWEPQTREFLEFRRSLSDDDLYCSLDSDDCYALDFLEKMIPFMRENDLDLAACGNNLIDRESNAVAGKRVLPETLILNSPKDFADLFPKYHQFMRTVWGKVYTGKAARHIFTEETKPQKFRNIKYGMDTLMVFSVLRHCRRVGIYPEALHDYYVSNKSVSYRWENGRTESDQILYEDAENFLLSYGKISPGNREFLYRVYVNAVSDTLGALNNAAGITPAEKLAELEKIAEYPRTKEAFSLNCLNSMRCKSNFISALISLIGELGEESNGKIAVIAEKYMPRCAKAVGPKTAKLFLSDSGLTEILVKDDRAALVEHLLKYISENKFTKQYDLSEAVFALSVDNPLLCGIKNSLFPKKYGKAFLLVFRGKYAEALDLMTDMLLKKEMLDEDFFTLYCNLSALLERANEFVFGKIKLAAFYFSQGRLEECKSVIADLEYMGVEENEEIEEIKRCIMRISD